MLPGSSSYFKTVCCLVVAVGHHQAKAVSLSTATCRARHQPRIPGIDSLKMNQGNGKCLPIVTLDRYLLTGAHSTIYCLYYLDAQLSICCNVRPLLTALEVKYERKCNISLVTLLSIYCRTTRLYLFIKSLLHLPSCSGHITSTDSYCRSTV